MSQRFLMGLDFGGSGGRCLLVDVDSGKTWFSARPWTHEVAPETGGVGYDLDLEDLWRRLGEASREALARAGATPQQVVGVAAASMRFGLVVVDANGDPVLAVPNVDARAAVQGLELAGQYGEEFHRATGHWPHPVCAASRLRHLATQKEKWERAHRTLAISDWVTYRLCGEYASEPSHASETLLFDLQAQDWADDRIAALGLRRELFPPLIGNGERVGLLTEAAARNLGLDEGIPVSMAGGDSQCAALGSGAIRSGQCTIIGGTTAPIQLVLDSPELDPEGRLWTARHVVPGRFVLESNAGPVGKTLEWFARMLYSDAAYPLARLNQEAAGVRIGSGGALSHLGAQIMNGRAPSIPMGSLSLSHLASPNDPIERPHLARAVLEGMAYGLRANAEQIFTLTSNLEEPVRLSAGMSQSPLFAQILADVLGRKLAVPRTHEATALGAAMCAGIGAGVFESAEEAATNWVLLQKEFVPRQESVSAYDDLYNGWRQVREAREPADAVAGGLAMQAIFTAPPKASRTQASFRPRILVTADMDEAGLDALRELGEVEYASYREVMRLLTGPDLVEALEGFQVFVTEVDVVDGSALSQLPDLRVIAVCRGDAVNLDLAACTALGIPALNAPGRNADAVADLTVAYMLMLARRLPEASSFLKQSGGEAGDMARMGQAFQTLRGRELWQKTVGLVGMGAVGRGVVRRVRGFGARVVVFDPFLSEEAIRAADAEPVSLDELLSTSDFVSLHAAVTDASRGLIGADQLASMKTTAFLINSARAALIDEEALIEALKSESIAGAALDVFSVEPPGADHPLLDLPNVICTPHVGGNTAEVAVHQGRIIADDLARLLAGQPPRHALNPEATHAFSWEGPRKSLSDEELEQLKRGPGPAVTDLQKEKKTSPEPKERSQTAMTEPSTSKTFDTSQIRDHMQRILDDFVERVKNDAALADFAISKDVILHFSLTDLRLEFHFGFQDDRVVGAVGAPDGSAGVQLKMPADVLDGMLTGRVNAMQAAMNGRLSFSGDTAKAMTIQHIQGDMTRLYSEARDAIGDPGDLTNLDGEASSPRAIQVEENDPRHELVAIVNELYAAQMITATGGNVSVRIPGTDELWITPSQLFKGDLRPEILVRINLEGEMLDEGARSPSSERLMHTAIFKARPDVQAVVHAHAPHATILINSDLPFLPISTEAAFFTNIARIPFIMPGTQALGDAIVEAMGKGWACLMQNHGLLVAGRSLRRAADMVEIIDRSAEVIIGCYSVGKEPPVLPKETVDMLSKMGDLIA